MSGYIGQSPVPQSTQTRQTFTATSGQTTFATGGYQPNYLSVYLNGIKLIDGTDYTATNGSDVVLTTGAATGDTLEVVAFSTFTVASQNFTGGLTVDNNAATVLTVDRATSDGTIIDVQKGGSTVGTLGSLSGGNFYIGTPAGNSGYILFADNQVSPATSTGAARDAAIDLGNPTRRFKDAYLSGGVYLGGTGSANLLDIVEEGSWTPNMRVGTTEPTYVTREGFYLRQNNIVTATFQLSISAFSGTGALSIGNLPFTVKNTSPGGGRGGSAIGYYQNLNNAIPYLMGDANTAKASLRKANGGGDFTNIDLGSVFTIYATLIYVTS